MEDADRLPDALSDYLASCLDLVDRTPKRGIGAAQQLRAPAHTTEFYALRTACRDDHIARSAHAVLLATHAQGDDR